VPFPLAPHWLHRLLVVFRGQEGRDLPRHSVAFGGWGFFVLVFPNEAPLLNAPFASRGPWVDRPRRPAAFALAVRFTAEERTRPSLLVPPHMRCTVRPLRRVS